jgi:hypothetical protein
MGKTQMELLKEVCTKIVGTWYSTQADLQMTFSLNDKLLSESPLIIQSGSNPPNKTIYGVAICGVNDDLTYQFYFDIHIINKERYFIVSITKDKMVLKYMENLLPVGDDILFERRVNTDGINEMLQELN